MRYSLLLIALLSLPALGQPVFEKAWQSDFNLTVRDAVAKPDGGAYLCLSGLSAGFDSSATVLVSVDADYDVLWAKRYRALLEDRPNALQILSDGGLLVGGRTTQNFALEEGPSLIKVNAAGEVVWHRVFDGPGDEAVVGAFELPGGRLLSVVRHGVNNQPGSLLLTDTAGNFLSRTRLFLDNVGVSVAGAAFDGNQTCYVVGDLNSATPLEDDLLVAAFSVTDTIALQWSYRYAFGRSARGSRAAVDGDGNLLVTGVIDNPNTTLSAFNGMLLRLSPAGAVQWAKEYFQEGSSQNNFLTGLHVDTGATLLTQAQFTEAGVRSVVFRVDEQGAVPTAVTAAAVAGRNLSLALPPQDGRLLLTGRDTDGRTLLVTTGLTGATGCNATTATVDVADLTPLVTFDTLTLTASPTSAVELNLVTLPVSLAEDTLCSATVSVLPATLPPARPTLYPNPTTGRVQIAFDGPRATVLVRDLTGRTVLTQTLAQPTFDVRHLPPGVYAVTVSTPTGTTAHRLVKR